MPAAAFLKDAMDLEVFVQEARLWNRDPGPQSDALIRRLRAENGETIIDLYEQALRSASKVFVEWVLCVP